MKTYPLMLDVRGKLAVVVGAGEVGLRKVHSLLDAGASVRLVTDRFDRKTMELGGLTCLTIIAEAYRPEHLAGARLVFACTDDREINARIAADASSAGALVNAVDQPEDCDFFVPSMILEGDVVVAIGTGGSAPAMAAWLKDRMSQALPPRVGEFAAALAAIREEIRTAVPDGRRRMDIMRRISTQEGYDLFTRSGPDALRQHALTTAQGL